MLLTLLLSRYVRNVNPHIRQAACVWLLAVVSKCSHYSEVQSRIMDLQDAFISLLSESDGTYRSFILVAFSVLLCS